MKAKRVCLAKVVLPTIVSVVIRTAIADTHNEHEQVVREEYNRAVAVFVGTVLHVDQSIIGVHSVDSKVVTDIRFRIDRVYKGRVERNGRYETTASPRDRHRLCAEEEFEEPKIGEQWLIYSTEDEVYNFHFLDSCRSGSLRRLEVRRDLRFIRKLWKAAR